MVLILQRTLTDYLASVVLPDYILHVLSSEWRQAYCFVFHEKRADQLALERIRSFQIPVPSAAEQQKIVEILSDCDATVKQTEQQLIAMKQRFKSFCDEAWRLGEDSNSLGQIGDFFSGLTGKSAADFGHGERFVTYMSVFDGPYVRKLVSDWFPLVL